MNELLLLWQVFVVDMLGVLIDLWSQVNLASVLLMYYLKFKPSLYFGGFAVFVYFINFGPPV